MKTFIYSFRKSIPTLLTGLIILVFISCGTHSNNDYDESDGIYSTNKSSTVEENASAIESEKNNYYKQYFNTKRLTYSDVPEEDVIFTDIEAYHTSESLDEEGYVVTEEVTDYEEGYGAWGTNSTETTINVYGGFGYSPYWGGGGYWGMSFGWGWGYPYYGYGWGYPYYGWGYPYYGYGYGYPYYGYGYGYPYYGSGYYNGYAYNRGRRNTDYYANRSSSRGNSSYSRGRTTSSRGSSSYTSRRGTYSRGETSRRSTYSSNNVRRSGNTYSNNSRGNTVNRANTTTRRSTNTNNYSRPSSSSSRSSSYRSSGSSYRSSGGSRSSGGGSRGGSSGGRRGGR